MTSAVERRGRGETPEAALRHREEDQRRGGGDGEQPGCPAPERVGVGRDPLRLLRRGQQRGERLEAAGDAQQREDAERADADARVRAGSPRRVPAGRRRSPAHTATKSATRKKAMPGARTFFIMGMISYHTR